MNIKADLNQNNRTPRTQTSEANSKEKLTIERLLNSDSRPVRQAATKATPQINFMQVRPRLKQGTIVLTREHSTYVGRMDQGIEIFSDTRTALSSMVGDSTCQEIATKRGLDLAELCELVLVLAQAHLIDTEISKIAVHSRFHSNNSNRVSHTSDDTHDGAYQQLQAKLSPELAFTTWLPKVVDGGVGIMGARRNIRVEIYGDSRIAILLYGILLASGVSLARIVVKDPRNIRETDVTANFLRPTDIGFSMQDRLQECVRELSLFPTSTSISAEIVERTFVISVGPPQAILVQEWMSRGIPHLAIDNPDGASISLGPIVVPGYSPCLRCIAMSKEENSGSWKDISWQRLNSPSQDVPVAVAHHVAGLAALEILHFIDEGESELIGVSERINYHNPREGERRLFTRHPACGCNW